VAFPIYKPLPGVKGREADRTEEKTSLCHGRLVEKTKDLLGNEVEM